MYVFLSLASRLAQGLFLTPLRLQPIPLEECSVRSHMRDSTEFTVTHRGDKIRVRAETPRAAATWVRDIDQAREACLRALDKARQHL